MTGIAVGYGGTILRTEDGGRHWSMQKSGSLQSLQEVCWSDSNTVTAVAMNGAILQSTDRGVSWVTRLYGGGPFELYDVVFTDRYNGFAAGTRTLLKTTDGGRSWEPRPCPSEKFLASISFCDSVTGMIVEGDGNAFFTTDAGETWIPKETGNRFYYSAALASSSIAVAVGINGTIVRTTDGGDTWVKTTPITTAAFWDVAFADSRTGYIVGNYGCILKTTDGGENWSVQSSNCTDFLHGVSVVDPEHVCTVGTAGTLLYSEDGGTTWDRQSDPLTSPLYSVSIPNKTHGVAVGYSMLGSGAWEGIVLRTDDGGMTWKHAHTVPDHVLRGVSLTDELTGTAVGSEGTILRTTDGGLTWTQQQSAAFSRLYAVQQIDPQTAIAVGYGGQVFRTEDGMTWKRQYAGPGDFFAVSFATPWSGCIVGDDGRVAMTTNGGATWEQIDLGLSGRGYVLRGVSFFDSTTGYIVGNGGTIFKTTDGGSSFIDLSLEWNTRELNSVTCIDANTAVAVGRSMILKTTDGGSQWIEQTGAGRLTLLHDTGAVMQELYSVCFVGRDFGTVVGSSGAILHTTTGGVTWIEERPATPPGFTLAQNYPNPFNPSTTIQYSLQKPQLVFLIVTDLYGRVVRRAIDGELKEAGVHLWQFDAAGLPSGVYFYSLLAGGQHMTRRMVLLR
jgi:photosystem II stability/assembly factor-like uncharacterized protein